MKMPGLLNPLTYLMLIAFIIPLGEMSRQFGHAFSGVKVATLVMLFITLAYKAIKREAFVRTPLGIPILFFMFAFLPSFVRSPDSANLPLVVATVAGYLMLTMVIVNFVVDVDSIKKIVGAFLVSLFFISIFALFQFITGLELLDLTGRGELNTWEGVVRVLGMSKNPNAFAVYLIVGVTLAFGRFLYSPKISNRFTTIILLGLYSTMMLFTLSRGAVVALLASILLISTFYIKRARISLVFSFIVFGIVLSLFWSEGINYRFMTSLTNPFFDISISDRFFAIKSAIPMFLDSPIFGVGFGNFKYEMISYGYGGVNLVGAHNTFVAIACELGLLGLVPFVIIVIVVIKNSLNGIRLAKNLRLKNLLIGLLGSFVGLLVMGLSHELYIHVLLWFLIGLLMAGANLAKREAFSRV